MSAVPKRLNDEDDDRIAQAVRRVYREYGDLASFFRRVREVMSQDEELAKQETRLASGPRHLRWNAKS